MVLDSRIRRVRDYYGIHTLNDWRKLSPADVTFVDGVGQATLDHIRLYLAARGMTLKGDHTPEHWEREIGRAKIVQEVADDETHEVCQFTIIVDVNETLPYRFDSIRTDKGVPVIVNTERLPLYRYGLADYTIRGMEQDIQIERKGDDLPSSLTARRAEFEQEIYRLDQTCEFAAVVVEHEWSEILQDTHEHGASAKVISRTVQSWSIKYPRVHWFMCANRSHAELLTFRLLDKFWRLKREEIAQADSIVRDIEEQKLFGPL